MEQDQIESLVAMPFEVIGDKALSTQDHLFKLGPSVPRYGEAALDAALYLAALYQLTYCLKSMGFCRKRIGAQNRLALCLMVCIFGHLAV